MLRAARPATTTPGRSRDRRFRSDWVDGVFPASCAPLPPDLTDEEWALPSVRPDRPFVARDRTRNPRIKRTSGQGMDLSTAIHPTSTHVRLTARLGTRVAAAMAATALPATARTSSLRRLQCGT